MGLLDSIKSDIQRTGSNKQKLVYFRDGTKKRLRFLNDMEDGLEINIHSNWEKRITAVCSEHYGKTCELCEQAEDPDSGFRSKTHYCWSVYDYDENKVLLFMFAVTRCSPLAQLAAIYENYGTLCDRDIIITQVGKGIDKTFTVMPMDKQKFKNTKAKPYSKQAVLKILREAYPDTDKYMGNTNEKLDEFNRVVNDDDEIIDSSEYDGKSAKELYKLCKERGLEAVIKKPAAFYINLLIEDDKANDDWGDEDDWDDEEGGDPDSDDWDE